MLKKHSYTTFAAVAIAGALALTGCSAQPTETSPKATTEAPEAAPTDAPTTTPSAEASGETPEWYIGHIGLGDLVGEGSTDTWSVQAFQVGTGTADKDSNEVDPDTRESLLPAGTEVVFLNFEVTNISDATRNINTVPTPAVKVDDWPFLGGQPGVVTPALYEAVGLTQDATDYQKLPKAPNDSMLFTVKPGETIAGATSIKYEPGTKPNVTVSFAEKDDSGELIESSMEDLDFTISIK